MWGMEDRGPLSSARWGRTRRGCRTWVYLWVGVLLLVTAPRSTRLENTDVSTDLEGGMGLRREHRSSEDSGKIPNSLI